MSRYRDDRAALEANVERLESELEDARVRLAQIDGVSIDEDRVEIDEVLGSPGPLGVPQSLGLRAELDRALSPERLEQIAAMLRLRLSLPVTVVGGAITSPDGRFSLRSIEGRTELRLDSTFTQAERAHWVGVALGTLATAALSGVLLHEAAGINAAAALSNLLWIVPVVGVVASPLLQPPYARRVLHEQEAIRDVFRAALALAQEEDTKPPAERLRVEEPEDLATGAAGDFEGDAQAEEEEEEEAEEEEAEEEEEEEEEAEEEEEEEEEAQDQGA